MCSSSGEAARLLQKLGFENVFAYEGGTAEWHSKGYPLDGPAKASYLTKVGQRHTPTVADVKIINAEELKNEMERAQAAGLLITNKLMAA